MNKNVIKKLNRKGFYPALYALYEIEGIDRERRLLQVAYARRVQHSMTDPRSIAVLDVQERYANGQASERELEGAINAAYAAAATTDEIAAASESAVTAAAFAREAVALSALRAESAWQEAELRRVCECIDAEADPYPRSEV